MKNTGNFWVLKKFLYIAYICLKGKELVLDFTKCFPPKINEYTTIKITNLTSWSQI